MKGQTIGLIRNTTLAINLVLNSTTKNHSTQFVKIGPLFTKPDILHLKNLKLSSIPRYRELKIAGIIIKEISGIIIPFSDFINTILKSSCLYNIPETKKNNGI